MSINPRTPGPPLICVIDKLMAFSKKDDKLIPQKLLYDSRLIRTRDGDYYLCLNTFKETIAFQSEIQALEHKAQRGVISLDPGVRTFMTGYDPSGKVYQWGNQDMSRICKLGVSYDQLQQKISRTSNHGSRYRMHKAGRRIQERIRNLVDETHKKLALFLCHNYRAIVIPEFNSSDMAKRWRRKISSKTVRQMLGTLSLQTASSQQTTRISLVQSDCL